MLVGERRPDNTTNVSLRPVIGSRKEWVPLNMLVWERRTHNERVGAVVGGRREAGDGKGWRTGR